MRVAIVTESFLPSVNGVTNSVLRVADTLIDSGHDVLIIAPTRVEGHYRKASVVATPHMVVAGFPIAIPSLAVSQSLDAFRPDLIHAAAPFWLGGAALSYAAKRQIPSVAIYQTDIAGYMYRYGIEFAGPIIDAMLSVIHKPATLNLAPTPDGARYLENLGLINVGVWGRGVDVELFSPNPDKSERARALRSRWASHNERILGYVGRLAPEKQVGRLKELLGIPNTKIVIVGDGPDRLELEDMFLGHPVVFTGQLVGQDLADAYAAIDVFVHCGVEETFGQTIQEAQASEVPVVAADRGGPRHLIRHNETGLLVNPQEWGAYRRAVTSLLDDQLFRHRIAQAGASAVAGKTWERNNEELLEYYRYAGSLLSGDRGTLSQAA